MTKETFTAEQTKIVEDFLRAVKDIPVKVYATGSDDYLLFCLGMESNNERDWKRLAEAKYDLTHKYLNITLDFTEANLLARDFGHFEAELPENVSAVRA